MPPRRLGRVIDVDDTIARDASSKTHPADADDVNLLFGSIILLYYVRVYYNMYTAGMLPVRRVRVSPVHWTG